MGLIKKYFIIPLGDYIAHKVITEWRQGAMQEMSWQVFSTLGLDLLDEVVKKGQDNRVKIGHVEYSSLGQLYAQRIKDISLERIKKIEESLRRL